jgi:hypothetical protein
MQVSFSAKLAPLLFVVPEQRQRPAWSQMLLLVREYFFSWENLTAVAETGMSKKLGIRTVGLLLSAVLNWYKRAAGRYRRLARRTAYQLKMVGRRKQFEAAEAMKVSPPFHADFAGSPVELREFTRVLIIGDRIRVLCDDGVLVAEKVSETQFRVIHSQTMAELVH